MAGLGVTAIGLVNHETAGCVRRAAVLDVLIATSHPQADKNERLRERIEPCTFISATLKLGVFANTIGVFNEVFVPLFCPANEVCSPQRFFDGFDFRNSERLPLNLRNASAGTNEAPQKFVSGAASGPRKENLR
jgi:hypothetical protein